MLARHGFTTLIPLDRRLRSTPHFQGSHGGPLRKELERAAPGVFGIGYGKC